MSVKSNSDKRVVRNKEFHQDREYEIKRSELWAQLAEAMFLLEITSTFASVMFLDGNQLKISLLIFVGLMFFTFFVWQVSNEMVQLHRTFADVDESIDKLTETIEQLHVDVVGPDQVSLIEPAESSNREQVVSYENENDLNDDVAESSTPDQEIKNVQTTQSLADTSSSIPNTSSFSMYRPTIEEREEVAQTRVQKFDKE